MILSTRRTRPSCMCSAALYPAVLIKLIKMEAYLPAVVEDMLLLQLQSNCICVPRSWQGYSLHQIRNNVINTESCKQSRSQTRRRLSTEPLINRQSRSNCALFPAQQFSTAQQQTAVPALYPLRNQSMASRQQSLSAGSY